MNDYDYELDYDDPNIDYDYDIQYMIQELLEERYCGCELN